MERKQTCVMGKNNYSTLNKKEWSETQPEETYWWDCGEHIFRETKQRQLRRRCPICINKLVIPGLNDLATTHPHLLKEYSSENIQKPWSIAATGVALWTCPTCSTTYPKRIKSKQVGKGCPICHGKKIIQGVNDLATTHPNLAQQLSNPSQASQLTQGSHQKVSWNCQKGHQWKAQVANRALGQGCPQCHKESHYAQSNDLASKHPRVGC